MAVRGPWPSLEADFRSPEDVKPTPHVQGLTSLEWACLAVARSQAHQDGPATTAVWKNLPKLCTGSSICSLPVHAPPCKVFTVARCLLTQKVMAPKEGRRLNRNVKVCTVDERCWGGREMNVGSLHCYSSTARQIES